jgi:hypothetical protein
MFSKIHKLLELKSADDIKFDVRAEFKVPDWWPTVGSKDPGMLIFVIRSLSTVPIIVEEAGFQVDMTTFFPVSTQSMVSPMRFPYQLNGEPHAVHVDGVSVTLYAFILRKRPRAYARCALHWGNVIYRKTSSFEIEFYDRLLPLLEGCSQ